MNVLMPQLGETVAEGKVAVWYKKEGDIVSKNEILADVETDKAAVEIPSPVEGVVGSNGFMQSRDTIYGQHTYTLACFLWVFFIG